MTTLVWDAVGERNFETGLDRGVLYLPETGVGVVWNGLLSVDERIDDTATPRYQDGVKYIDSEGLGHFAATLKAFTYPDEFEELEGFGSIAIGLSVDHQRPKRFHLSYRTKIGNDADGVDHGYQIHILYNLTAVPAEKMYATLASQVVPMAFSWALLGVPATHPGVRPTSHVILDSTEINSEKLERIEDVLYGTAGTDPYLPTIAELLALLIEPLILIVDHGDGTWSAIGPDELITMLDVNTFQITEANAVYLDAVTYEISNTI